jgi:hypothetical protein
MIFKYGTLLTTATVILSLGLLNPNRNRDMIAYVAKKLIRITIREGTEEIMRNIEKLVEAEVADASAHN